jgi:hypothetical protein
MYLVSAYKEIEPHKGTLVITYVCNIGTYMYMRTFSLVFLLCEV